MNRTQFPVWLTRASSSTVPKLQPSGSRKKKNGSSTFIYRRCTNPPEMKCRAVIFFSSTRASFAPCKHKPHNEALSVRNAQAADDDGENENSNNFIHKVIIIQIEKKKRTLDLKLKFMLRDSFRQLLLFIMNARRRRRCCYRRANQLQV